MNSQSLGLRGEKIAQEYLLMKGYSIMQTNFRTKFGEIDIICRDKNALIFIEVKTRRSSNHGYPYEAVNKAKIKKIYKVGQYFASAYHLEHLMMRIDVISIVFNIVNSSNAIEHLKNITSL